MREQKWQIKGLRTADSLSLSPYPLLQNIHGSLNLTLPLSWKGKLNSIFINRKNSKIRMSEKSLKLYCCRAHFQLWNWLTFFNYHPHPMVVGIVAISKSKQANKTIKLKPNKKNKEEKYKRKSFLFIFERGRIVKKLLKGRRELYVEAVHFNYLCLYFSSHMKAVLIQIHWINKSK